MLILSITPCYPWRAGGQQERHTREVLGALAAAAETVRQWEFSHKYGEWVEGAAGSLPQETVQFQQQAEQVRVGIICTGCIRTCLHCGVPRAVGPARRGQG